MGAERGEGYNQISEAAAAVSINYFGAGRLAPRLRQLRGQPMTSSLSDASLTDLTGTLRQANEEFSHHYPGETGRRQPVHTVYGGAHPPKSDPIRPRGSRP